MTPAARNEIAIGMKITVLNAVAHRIRSDSTANTNPKKVTTTGATATHTALLRMATSVRCDVNTSLKFATATNVEPAAS